MAGGIDISTGAAESLGAGAALAIVSVSTGGLPTSVGNALGNAGLSIPGLGAYRPYQQNRPATYSITIPANTQNSGQAAPLGAVPVDSNGVGTLSTSTQSASAAPQFYVFDAVFVANHRQRVRKVKSPLQSGYNITYHAVLEEGQLALEIGMSDAMTAYTDGMWQGNASKSVSAFQTMVALMKSRVLMTLSTRQQTYTNMMLIDIESPETNKTFSGLKATLVFEETFLVQVASQTISARPNATDSTQQATIAPTDVPPTITQQNQITPAQLPAQNSDSDLNSMGIPAGGAYSSNNLGIPGLPDIN